MSTANCAADDSLIGSRIDGRYTVHRVLGQGGMGVVYEGVHDELGRAVAIKVLNAAWAADRTAVERFLREARTASSFSHSNIVDVSDLGRLSDGRPYLVMPKITGTDLATLLIENGPQPAKRVAALLAGVASALDLVHAKGYVHRDIKPENLMYVVREDGSETVMLLDFGIAAAVMSSGPRLTRQGAIFGTPHYLPPEVCTGARCDARGDVYSLAAVAFELITGMLPFSTEDIMQLMAQKVSYDAPSLAAVSGTVFPVDVEKVIATGLARDPRFRYASASAFVSALRAATQAAPVSWRTGVVRSSMRSAEHVLPQFPQLPEAGARPGWEVERAPTWPIGSLRPAEQRPTDTDETSYPSYPRHATPPRYADESSSVRRFNSFQSAESGYPLHPVYTTPDAGQHAPSSHPPQTMNPGVWAAHAAPRGYYTSPELAGGGAYDGRLRMHEDGTLAVKKRGSLLPVLIGVAAFAALGMGGVQLMMARRTSQQTDARASTLPGDSGSSSRQLQARPTRPSAPSTPSTLSTGAVLRPPASANIHKPASPALASPATPSARPPAGLPSEEPSPAPVPSVPSMPTMAPGASSSAATPSSSHGSHQGSSREREPNRSRDKPHERGSREGAASTAASSLGGSPPEPAIELPSAPASSSVVTVVPIIPEPSAAPPEPEVSTPAVAPEAAANFAKQSSTALLRGEVTRAIDLARRATQADASYAIAWRSLGLALERAGAVDQAMDAYSKYLQRAPSGPQAEMVRQRMQSLVR